MIKNKMNKIILLLYFLTIGTYAHARVITVDQCPVPFDFTIGDFCVLSTLGTMFIIPIIIVFCIVLFWEKINEFFYEKFKIKINYIILSLSLIVIFIIFTLLYF